jgi:TRAP-type uncharacterized transport system fused permease subunit
VDHHLKTKTSLWLAGAFFIPFAILVSLYHLYTAIFGLPVVLAVAGFIIPYIFVLSPQLMLINTTLGEGLFTAATAALGVFLLAVACEGYVYAPVNVVMRLVSLAGALLLMIPGIQTDIVGAVI